MASKAVLNTVLFLRIFTLLALAASIVVMALNNFEDDDDRKTRFTELVAYRYVIASGCIGIVYTLIQIPFAIYNVVHEKRWIRTACLQQVDFYGDKVIAFLLASGVSIGFGVTFELKRIFGDNFSNKAEKFLDMGNISTGLLLVGFVCMALLSVFSSIRWSSSDKRFFK